MARSEPDLAALVPQQPAGVSGLALLWRVRSC